jgi:N-acetylmuramoyl-L-alanine amidase
MKIAIDPGHGMSNRRPGVFDSGAIHTEGGTEFQEAEIALDYGLALKAVFLAKGHSVFMTRDDNTDETPVGERAGNAKRAGADVFISLHLNDSDDDSANGLEVLYRGDDDKPLAQALQDKLIEVTRFRDREIKRREDLAVLKFDGPAVLIELGFIANDGNRGALINEATRAAICEAIATVTISELGGGTGGGTGGGSTGGGGGIGGGGGTDGGGAASKAKVNAPSDDTLTIRDAANANATAVGHLSPGTVVEIFAESGIWRRIDPAAERWVSSKFLIPVDGGATGPSGACDKEVVDADRPVTVFRLPGRDGFFYKGRMTVDADGAPKCYHPDDAPGLDRLANATSDSKKFIQGKNGIGPAPGFFVSGTSLNSGAENRCDTYVDAVNIPYIVFYSNFPGVKVGDVAMVVNLQNGKRTHAIIADTNSGTKGEASVRTAEALGIPSSPRHGGTDSKIILYIIFPGTKFAPVNPAPHWPDDKIRAIAEEKFAAWGGMVQVKACFPELPV